MNSYFVIDIEIENIYLTKNNINFVDKSINNVEIDIQFVIF